MRLVVESNSELFWLVPRRGDAGVAGATSRSRNDGSGQKSRNYEYELTARDTICRNISGRARGGALLRLMEYPGLKYLRLDPVSPCLLGAIERFVSPFEKGLEIIKLRRR